jgi:hypothetical protein
MLVGKEREVKDGKAEKPSEWEGEKRKRSRKSTRERKERQKKEQKGKGRDFRKERNEKELWKGWRGKGRGCSLVVLQLGIEEKIFPMATRRGT